MGGVEKCVREGKIGAMRGADERVDQEAKRGKREEGGGHGGVEGGGGRLTVSLLSQGRERSGADSADLPGTTGCEQGDTSSNVT